ncbi:MAG: acetate--CoA ligase [Oligoflexia bacterium]|nr:acetate--CoA ligase [Oligoflexia bacterium]
MDLSISTLSNENRKFTPSTAFASQANLKSHELNQLCELAKSDWDGFWTAQGSKLNWSRPFEKVIQWEEPFAKWFLGGKLNASSQCLDKNLPQLKDKTALIWEGEPGEVRKLTYQELYQLTCQTAHALKNLGVKRGDRVAIYMPLVPEAIAAMLACARIGAVHSVVFAGFSAESLKERINDSQCVAVITADGGYRKGAVINLKDAVDQALLNTPSVKKTLVLKRTGQSISMTSGRDFWWHDVVHSASPEIAAEDMDSEDLLFILYTSGSTGKPKGIVHSTAGFCLWTMLTSQWVFDLKPQDIYWCTADIGWITGHSYLVYGPLQNGATLFMYEGAPNHPDFGRFWKMIESHKITILYTAPTAIRAFMRAGDEFVNKHNLSSLRLLGSVGEPINPEAWIWYNKNIGKEKCPVVDTWWQTETGGILLSPVPGVTATKPGSCTQPLPGIFPKVVKKDGTACKPNEGGYLILEKPWPSMTRGIYGDPERFKKTYWSEFKGKYFTGDGARQDADGYFWVIGRVDDVLNVSGHRLGTAEIESALVSHPMVAEAAVVGRPDEIKGQGIVAFVTLKAQFSGQDVSAELKSHVAKEIGALARPDDIRFTDALPKTRSGKIMRRLLRELASQGKIQGDTTTLEDMNVINKLASAYEDEE